MNLSNLFRVLTVSMVCFGPYQAFADTAPLASVHEQDAAVTSVENVISEEGRSISDDVIDFEHDGDLEIGDVRPLGRRGQSCHRYNNNPRLCERLSGCQYSRIYSQCLPSTGPVNPYPGNQCSNFDYDYTSCVRSGCSFDGRSGQCYSGYNPGPVQPIYCSQYDYDRYSCERNGCTFDYRSNQCFGQ